MNPGDPINPQRVFWELSARLPDDCILSADSGTTANWFARDLKIRRGMKASLSGTLATMGSGVPYAIAAKFAYPRPRRDRARRRRRDADERQRRAHHGREVLAALERPAADRARAQQPRSQLGHVGAARDGGRPEVRRPPRTLPDFPYARYAELIGLRGIRVETPDEIGPAWDAALAADRPVVLEAITDPEIAAAAAAHHLRAGQVADQRPAQTRPVAEHHPPQLREKIQEFLPHRS